jgi:hypothetical protein
LIWKEKLGSYYQRNALLECSGAGLLEPSKEVSMNMVSKKARRTRRADLVEASDVTLWV